jgi:hypothetical protein
LLSVAYAPLAAAAPEDEPTGMSNLQLLFYPEYDDARLLVILRGQITGVTASTTDPAIVRFMVPSTAEMYSAGFFNAQGGYVRGGFVDPTKVAGDPFPERKSSAISGWDEITFTMETNRFVVEYYDPVIVGNSDKTIASKFHFLYPIADMDVVIMKPRAASNFSVVPQGTSVDHDAFGSGDIYEAHAYDLINLTVGTDSPLEYAISYTKSDPRPSIEITDGSAGLIVGITSGIIAAAVVAYFLLRFFQTKKGKRKSPAKRRSGGPSSKKQGPQKFCRQCGKQMDRKTPFCPYCGAKQ